MIGFNIAENDKKYNIIILAGGKGERMGVASDYIPKALSKIGNQRAIDYLLYKYFMVANKFIIGTGSHHDLLSSYITGRYNSYKVEFSYEPVNELRNNALSTLYCLDHADSRYGTIICFCDLLVISNNVVKPNTMYLASKETKGNIGTFRHSFDTEKNNLVCYSEPVAQENLEYPGILGNFVFENTYMLKEIAYYGVFEDLSDLTEDIVYPYFYNTKNPNYEIVDTAYEFGNENDLQKVRKLWEDAKL